MHVVMTRVKLRPRTAASCAALFKHTNPGLVRDQPDWLGARMIFDEATDVVTVLATWRNVEAYEAMSAQPAYQETMKEFAEFFAAPPEVSTHMVLVDMTPEP